jgi:hypothetical protein
MQIKEHEYVRQTLERYTNCKLGDMCDHVLITNYMETHLDLALDAVHNIGSNWKEVKRQLTSEW